MLQPIHKLLKKMKIFQKKSSVTGFNIAQRPYLEALQHPKFQTNSNELSAIIVPINISIDRDILMRMLPTSISIVGITTEMFDADGFTRPTGDFWMHDIRHESARLLEIKKFIESREITNTEWQEFSRLQEGWYLEYQQEIEKIQDPDLKEAVDLLMFNYFHDRGYPLVPSVWESRSDMYIYYGLVFILTISGQGTGFKNVISNSNKASKWLDDFWKKRAPEEVNFFEKIKLRRLQN